MLLLFVYGVLEGFLLLFCYVIGVYIRTVDILASSDLGKRLFARAVKLYV
jgi:hypothetical protein